MLLQALSTQFLCNIDTFQIYLFHQFYLQYSITTFMFLKNIKHHTNHFVSFSLIPSLLFFYSFLSSLFYNIIYFWLNTTIHKKYQFKFLCLHQQYCNLPPQLQCVVPGSSQYQSHVPNLTELYTFSHQLLPLLSTVSIIILLYAHYHFIMIDRFSR